MIRACDVKSAHFFTVQEIKKSMLCNFPAVHHTVVQYVDGK